MKTISGVEQAVRVHPFLSGLDPMFFDAFCDCASIRRFASQQQIFHEGGEADHFYLIISGKVALETFVPGCGMVTIQSLGAGTRWAGRGSFRRTTGISRLPPASRPKTFL